MGSAPAASLEKLRRKETRVKRRKTAAVNRGTESVFQQGVKVRDDLDAQWGARSRCEPQVLCCASPEAPGMPSSEGSGAERSPFPLVTD